MAVFIKIYYGQDVNNLSVKSDSGTDSSTGTVSSQFYLGRYGALTIPMHGYVKYIRFFKDITLLK